MNSFFLVVRKIYRKPSLGAPLVFKFDYALRVITRVILRI